MENFLVNSRGKIPFLLGSVIPDNATHYYQRNHRPYHVGLLQIDTFYLDTLSNNSVNINGRHCMKHGNRQSTDALQQLSPAVGLRPGLGKVKVTVFRVTASSLSTPHTAHCALPPINSFPFLLYPGGALPPLLCRGTQQPSC